MTHPPMPPKERELVAAGVRAASDYATMNGLLDVGGAARLNRLADFIERTGLGWEEFVQEDS